MASLCVCFLWFSSFAGVAASTVIVTSKHLRFVVPIFIAFLVVVIVCVSRPVTCDVSLYINYTIIILDFHLKIRLSQYVRKKRFFKMMLITSFVGQRWSMWILFCFLLCFCSTMWYRYTTVPFDSLCILGCAAIASNLAFSISALRTPEPSPCTILHPNICGSTIAQHGTPTSSF